MFCHNVVYWAYNYWQSVSPPLHSKVGDQAAVCQHKCKSHLVVRTSCLVDCGVVFINLWLCASQIGKAWRCWRMSLIRCLLPFLFPIKKLNPVIILLQLLRYCNVKAIRHRRVWSRSLPLSFWVCSLCSLAYIPFFAFSTLRLLVVVLGV